MTPIVSIIVPAWNYARFLPDALRSIQNQTLGDWECIVVDDGSTDHTQQVVGGFASADTRIRYRRQEHQRHPAARNTGIAASRAKYIQFLDADDLLEPRKLAHHAQFLDAHPDVDIVYGGARYFRDRHPDERLYSMSRENQPWMPQISGSGREILAVLLRQNIMPVSSPLLRRSVINDVGPFDETLRRADDWDYWLRCAIANKRFVFSDAPDARALIRAHGASLTQSGRDLIRSTLITRQKLEDKSLDPDLAAANQATIHWLSRLLRLTDVIDQYDQPFILVDEDEIRAELSDYRAIPFTEKAGEYNGPPADDAAAIAELERLKLRNPAILVFAWPALWWLDHYAGFHAHIRARHARVHADNDCVIFDLRG